MLPGVRTIWFISALINILDKTGEIRSIRTRRCACRFLEEWRSDIFSVFFSHFRNNVQCNLTQRKEEWINTIIVPCTTRQYYDNGKINRNLPFLRIVLLCSRIIVYFVSFCMKVEAFPTTTSRHVGNFKSVEVMTEETIIILRNTHFYSRTYLTTTKMSKTRQVLSIYNVDTLFWNAFRIMNNKNNNAVQYTLHTDAYRHLSIWSTARWMSGTTLWNVADINYTTFTTI